MTKKNGKKNRRVAPKDVLGIRDDVRKRIVRKLTVGTAAVVVTLTPLIVFGCTNK